MLAMLFVGIVVSLLGFAFYRWAIRNYDHFEGSQLDYIKPTFLVGSTAGFFLSTQHVDKYMQTLYNAFPTAKIVGMFDFRQPMFLLRDPEIIKQMAVKDFDHFEDHRTFVDSTVDELFGNSLFVIRGEKWREMRAALSPAFTGSKMRLMFDMVDECAVDMVRVLRERTNATETSHTMRADVKDLLSRFTNDVIATTAFGIKVNSFADETNEFFVNGKKALNFGSWTSALKFSAMRACPSVMRLLNIQLLQPDVLKFFRSMALDTIQTRLEQKIYRPDIINLLMKLKTNSAAADKPSAEDTPMADDSAGFATVEESHIGKAAQVQRKWNDSELAAQCFLFFAGGFDSTSSMMSFLFYELAINPDVQQKLFDECVEVRSLLKNSKLTYESLQKLPYMDQVVSETMRKWPPAPMTDRLCVRDYVYDDGDLRFEVKKDMSLWIPIYALHRDDQYYAEPERFWPERFSDELKSHIVPGTYLPFGVGPRNCIGSRFALMEIKAIVYHILLSFRLEPTEDTLIPMRLAKGPGTIRPLKNIVLALKQRKSI